MCELDEAKGLDPGTVYHNLPSCSIFLHSIADVERQKTKDMLAGSKFVSLTSDGTTEVTGREQESL